MIRIILLTAASIISGCSTSLNNIHKEQDEIIAKVAESAEKRHYYAYATYLREKYLANNTEDFSAMQALVIDLENTNKWNKSIQYLAKMLEKKPNDSDLLIHLGHAYSHLGYWDKAYDTYKKVLSIKPDASAYNGMGVVLNSSKQFNKAMVCFDASLKINPNDRSALNNKAITYAMLNKNKQAINILRNISIIYPNSYYGENLRLIKKKQLKWQKLFKNKSKSKFEYSC